MAEELHYKYIYHASVSGTDWHGRIHRMDTLIPRRHVPETLAQAEEIRLEIRDYAADKYRLAPESVCITSLTLIGGTEIDELSRRQGDHTMIQATRELGQACVTVLITIALLQWGVDPMSLRNVAFVLVVTLFALTVYLRYREETTRG